MADVKLGLDPVPKPADVTAPAAASAGAAAAAAAAVSSTASASASPVAADELDTVVCVVAARGVAEDRVEPNIEAMAEAGLLVLERKKMELTPEVASVFAVDPSARRTAASDTRKGQTEEAVARADGRRGPGLDLAVELANIPEAKHLAVELFVSATGAGAGGANSARAKSIATQTESVTGNANPKFQTHLFVPYQPFVDSVAPTALGDEKDVKTAPALGVEYELRVLNRASTVSAAASDLLAVVPLDSKQLAATTGSLSFPLSNHSDAAADAKLKQSGAVLTIRAAPSKTSIRPDRVLIHVTARNLPVAPPPPKPKAKPEIGPDGEPLPPKPTATGLPEQVLPEPLGHSVVCVLIPKRPTKDNGEQLTEAIVGNANPTFTVPFSVPRPTDSEVEPESVMSPANQYDLQIWAASTDAPQTPAALAAAANNPRGDLLATIQVNVSKLVDSPGGCQSFVLADSPTSELNPHDQTVRIARGKGWGDKLLAADASVTIVGVTTQPSEEGQLHANKDELASVRAFTSGPVVCLLVRGANAFIKLKHLTVIRELDYMYFSAETWSALRDSLLLFPARHGRGLSQQRVERTLAILKPGTTAPELDAVLRAVDEVDMVVVARDKRVLDAKVAKALFPAADAEELAYLSSDVSEVVVFEAPGAVDQWQLLLGPADPTEATKRAPQSLRGRFARSRIRNLAYASLTPTQAKADIALLFRDPFPLQRTLAIIKPDAVAAGSTDAILSVISEQYGFAVLATERTRLSKPRAEQFYAEHAGKPFFNALVEFMSSGPVVALCLAKPAAIASWRKLIGPTRRNEALSKKPHSLRARFGHSDTQNACHGSEHDKAADREIQFFFPQLPAEALPTEVEQLKAIFNAKPFAPRGPNAKAPKSLNDVLVDGLTALCRERPLKLDAVKWLGQWLLRNNPNQPTVEVADADADAVAKGTGKGADSKIKFIGSADRDEKTAAVTAPVTPVVSGPVAAPPAPRKMVWVVGPAGVGKNTLCARLAKEFGYEHVNVGNLCRSAIRAGSDYADLLTDCALNGRVVPSSVVVPLLQQAMRASPSANNRWLISDFPSSLDQAFDFESATGGAVSFIVQLTVASDATLKQRIEERTATTPAFARRSEDNAASVDKRLALFREDIVPQVLSQFAQFPGKVRAVNVDGNISDAYARLKTLFEPKVLAAPDAAAAGAGAGAAAGSVSSPKKGKKVIGAPAPAPPAVEYMKINGV